LDILVDRYGVNSDLGMSQGTVNIPIFIEKIIRALRNKGNYNYNYFFFFCDNYIYNVLRVHNNNNLFFVFNLFIFFIVRFNY